MGDENDIVELSTENDALKNNTGSFSGKWLEESKPKLLKQIDDEKKGKFNYVWDEKQIEKHYVIGIYIS